MAYPAHEGRRWFSLTAQHRRHQRSPLCDDVAGQDGARLRVGQVGMAGVSGEGVQVMPTNGERSEAQLLGQLVAPGERGQA